MDWLLFSKGILIAMFSYLEVLVKQFIPKKKKSLGGEIVLITGAAHGLGKGIASAFSKHQCQLVLWDINKQGVEETAEECRKLGAFVHSYVVDCGKREDIYRTADKMKKDIGDITILVNNAGVITIGGLLSIKDEDIQNMFEVNVLAHHWTVKAFLPAMIAKNYGHIVTIASVSGWVGAPFMVTYSASKSGCISFHQTLKEELHLLGKDGIKTTCLCPYWIDTGFTKDIITKVLPLLDTEYTVNKLMEGILTNQEMIVLPAEANVMAKLSSLLPGRVPRFATKIERTVIDRYKNQCQSCK
ncbi:17-beta-hydroxysteroid dehydrogenase 13-like [Eublepharis macularius]|uniref:Estradiol 17-beta-dehydrogenase 11 n=1 Tax=Eublepharis macularius TaxID=481883 RepID=A0AA97JZC8_EUBMA|nr:17-beta-hydroxysteroid dehydrogenase 13-like [Eublepharis macularius]